MIWFIEFKVNVFFVKISVKVCRTFNLPIMKKRTSPIWSLPENEFIKLVQTSKRMKDVLGFFNLKNKGGNNKTVN